MTAIAFVALGFALLAQSFFLLHKCPGHPLECLTNFAPVPVCMCKLIIVVRDWVRVFRLSLACGTAARLCNHFRILWKGKSGKIKMKSQVAVYHVLILDSWSSFFVLQMNVFCFLSISLSSHQSSVEKN